MARFCCLLWLCVAVPSYAFGSPEEFFRAIRENNLKLLKQLCTDRAAVKQAGERGTTPLHYAAAFGSVRSVQALLASGADVNAKDNAEATPLLLAAYSPEKVKLLLDSGADPSAKSKNGRTPLIVASGLRGATHTVKLLLDKGADLDVADFRGNTALLQASDGGDLETVRLLLERGAKADIANPLGFTALHGSLTIHEAQRAQLLLSKGANVNTASHFGGKVRHGDINLKRLTPLFLTAEHGSPEGVGLMLKHGADVNAREGRGLTPLMGAVLAEQDVRVIRNLLDAGADVNVKDIEGETALDWARRVGNPAVIEMLEKAGGEGRPAPTPPVRTAAPYDAGKAVQLGLGLLQKSSTEFFKMSGCSGCHHQPIASMAAQATNSLNKDAASTIFEEMKRGATVMRPAAAGLLQFIAPGGTIDTVSWLAMGLQAADTPPDFLTDAIVHYLAGLQQADGRWSVYGISRPPFEEGSIGRTSHAIRVLRAYGWPARRAEFDDRIARAKAWLLNTKPQSPVDKAERLLGLYFGGGNSKQLQEAAKDLLRDQKGDGGWSQNAYLSPDAYATGLALHALLESGMLDVSTPVYKKGANFLLRTQLEDGSWYVRSRSPKFQPYFESGFPHSHDQWISAVATGYSVMALAPAVPKV